MRLAVRPLYSLLAMAAAVGAVAACSANTLDMPAGLGGQSAGSVVVYGQATSASLSGVVATVTAIAEDSACSGIPYGSASGTTSTAGTYRITLARTSPLAGCVVVTANAGGATATSTSTGVPFGTGDSVQINLLMP
jgi:hypothetical protein